MSRKKQKNAQYLESYLVHLMMKNSSSNIERVLQEFHEAEGDIKRNISSGLQFNG